MTVLKFFRSPGVSEDQILRKIQLKCHAVINVRTEYCFYIDIGDHILNIAEREKILWLLRETFEVHLLNVCSYFIATPVDVVIEVGPRLAFSTAFSSNCLNICKACGIPYIERLERSRRYMITTCATLTPDDLESISSLVCDRMTECIYRQPLESFESDMTPTPVKLIPLLSEGKSALEKINAELGLGFDAWDVEFYFNMFVNILKRDPTDVECFDLGQSNSEHSRHWFFGGKMIIDDHEHSNETLFSMVKSTLPKSSNSVIAFHDNSSVSF